MEHDILVSNTQVDFIEYQNAEEGHKKALKIELQDANTGDAYTFDICECEIDVWDKFFNANLIIFREWVTTGKFPMEIFNKLKEEQESSDDKDQHCTS